MQQRRRSGTARRLLTVGAVVLVVAVVLVGLVAVFQRSLIYFPDGSNPPPAAEVVPGARDVTLHTSDDLELGAWLVPAQESADTGLGVLYFPGNAGHRAGRAEIAEALAERGLTVLLVDYRGYGGNPGSPTEGGLTADALAAQELLEQEGYPADRQLYVGESLGTGVAAGLAAARPPAGMLLRSPFTELADVGRAHYPFLPVGWLLRDRYPVLEHVRELQAPLTVVRGSRDGVVPTELTHEVAQAAPQLVEEVVLEGDHNDAVMFGEELADAVARLADAVGDR